MPAESKSPSTFRFGPFELSFETEELRKNGVRLRLFGQPIKVLILLVETPGQLVTREKLQESLWPGLTVGDFERGLNAAISRLRENLGDSADDPQYIETVPRRGYRFIENGESDTHQTSLSKPELASPLAIELQTYSLIAYVPWESAIGRAAEVVVWVRYEFSGKLAYSLQRKIPGPPFRGAFYERAFALESSSDEDGNRLSTDVVLRLDSPNFEPSTQVKRLSVPPGADSSPCTFLMKPCLPGELVANLELLLSTNEKVVASRAIRTRALHLGDDDFRSESSISFGVLKEIYEGTRDTPQSFPPKEVPTSEQQTRVLEAAAPQESTVGHSIEVIAMVREDESRGGLRALLLKEKVPYLTDDDVRERPFELEFPLDNNAKPLPLNISLRLESPGFDPPTQIKRLCVPPTGDSPACTFLIIPRIVGEHVMNLDLLNPYEQMLVSRSIRTKALPSGAESSPVKRLVTIPLVVMIRHTPAAESSEASLLDQLLECATSRVDCRTDFLRSLFLEAPNPNSTHVLENVLQTLLEASLRLTKAERGFVFLRDPDNELRMVAGRDKNGESIHDDSTISRSVLRDAASSKSEFLVTDASESEKILNRESVVAQNLKSIICIPLRRTNIQGKGAEQAKAETSELLGVMYLDSHFLAGKLSSVSQDILRTIANGAAALVENAALVDGWPS